MKKSIVACTLLFTLVLPVNALCNTRLVVNDTLTSLKTQPVNDDGTLMVGMREIFSILGADVEWNQSKKTVTAKAGKTVKITLNDTNAQVDGKTVQLAKAPRLIDDLMYVPLRFVAEAFEAKVDWNQETQTVNISYASNQVPTQLPELNRISFFDKSLLSSAKTKLSYKQVVDMAIAANSTLQTLADSAESFEENIKDKRSKYLQVGPLGIDPTNVALLRTLSAYENQLRNLPLNEKITKDYAEFLTLNYITNIENDKLDIILLTESLALDEINIRNLQLKQTLGLASDDEIRTAKQNLEKSTTNKDILELVLLNEKLGFNNYLKISTNNDNYVEHSREYKPISVSNAASYAIANSVDAPTIKILKTALDEAEYSLKLHTSNLDEQKIDKENAVKKAARDYNDARQELEKKIISTVNQIKQLEEKRKSAEIDLNKARETYRNLSLNLQLGNITENDLKKGRLAVLSAEIELEKITNTHNLLKFRLERPHLL